MRVATTRPERQLDDIVTHAIRSVRNSDPGIPEDTACLLAALMLEQWAKDVQGSGIADTLTPDMLRNTRAVLCDAAAKARERARELREGNETPYGRKGLARVR